jgi:hypothetical protein
MRAKIVQLILQGIDGFHGRIDGDPDRLFLGTERLQQFTHKVGLLFYLVNAVERYFFFFLALCELLFVLQNLGAQTFQLLIAPFDIRLIAGGRKREEEKTEYGKK